jgi:hypothetical protein
MNWHLHYIYTRNCIVCGMSNSWYAMVFTEVFAANIIVEKSNTVVFFIWQQGLYEDSCFAGVNCNSVHPQPFDSLIYGLVIPVFDLHNILGL